MPYISPKTRRQILVCLLLGVLAATMLLAGCQNKPAPVTAPQGSVDPDPEQPPAGKTEPPEPLSPITGLPMGNPGHPVAVSTDNLSPARPQSGLSQADIVYEVLAEGPVTRYLAIYLSESPEVVGPVRSVRPYLALLAKEWNAVLAHCGASPDGYKAIEDLKVLDANDMTQGGLFWRDNSRKMPHNLYGSIETLRKVGTSPAPETAQRYEFQDWSDDPLPELEIRYGRTYAVRYVYSDGKYRRVVHDGSLNPFVQADRDTGEECAVSNVIVQFAKSRVLDAELRIAIDLIGEGKAVYLLGGRYLEGTWKKESAEEPTWFYTADGEKITLTPGQTWVQIVPMDAKVTGPATE